MSENLNHNPPSEANLKASNDFSSLSKEELIALLQTANSEISSLKQKISNKTKTENQQSQHKDKKAKKLEKVLKNSSERKIALRLFYIGIEYQGFERQVNVTNTIENHFFAALQKTMLIKEIPNSDYTRAGRTDRGVSAFANVVALKLRCSDSKSPENKLNYVKMINSALPKDIRVTASAEVAEDFNARYHCIAREYKYFFVKNLLDVEKMRKGAEFFIGEHDFRNFCKINPSNTIDHIRTIFSITIEEADIQKGKLTDPRMIMFCAVIKANSFLWHQIRCMMEVLFQIGNGYDSPDVIMELLNVDKNPRRPSYAFAADFPLVLSNCYYDNLEFKHKLENNMDLYETLKESFFRKAIETCFYNTMMGYFINIATSQYENLKTEANLLEALLLVDKEKREKRKSMALMAKPKGKTLEQCIESLTGKDKEIYLQKLEKKKKYDERKNIVE